MNSILLRPLGCLLLIATTLAIPDTNDGERDCLQFLQQELDGSKYYAAPFNEELYRNMSEEDPSKYKAVDQIDFLLRPRDTRSEVLLRDFERLPEDIQRAFTDHLRSKPETLRREHFSPGLREAVDSCKSLRRIQGFILPVDCPPNAVPMNLHLGGREECIRKCQERNYEAV